MCIRDRYWQKRFDRENPDQAIEDKILEIHNTNKDYGYRRTVSYTHLDVYKRQIVEYMVNFEIRALLLIKRKYRESCRN